MNKNIHQLYDYINQQYNISVQVERELQNHLSKIGWHPFLPEEKITLEMKAIFHLIQYHQGKTATFHDINTYIYNNFKDYK